MATLNFHVRHEVQPERLWAVLDGLINQTDYQHITQPDRQLSRLRQLGLVAASQPVPTDDGQALHRIGLKRLEVAWELLHFLHYTRWQPTQPTLHTMFFTYRAYCDLLYDQREANLPAQRHTFTAEITSTITASVYFADEIASLTKGAVSLSVNSLIGVERWLSKLAPEVITADGQFTLRHYCSNELLLMALGYLSAQTDTQLGVEQLVTAERRELLSRVCLIDESTLDQRLDWLALEYPDFVQPGTTTGSYGRFVRVLKLPSLKDMLR